MHYQDPFILRAAARGLANRPVQVIMTSGPQRDLATLGLGTLASNVRVEQWVSHDDLLPHCAALVTTGGAGSVKAALKYGVPMVVIPTHWDKSDNAQRIVQAGAGLRIGPGRCTPARLRVAVGRVCASRRFGRTLGDLHTISKQRQRQITRLGCWRGSPIEWAGGHRPLMERGRSGAQRQTKRRTGVRSGRRIWGHRHQAAGETSLALLLAVIIAAMASGALAAGPA